MLKIFDKYAEDEKKEFEVKIIILRKKRPKLQVKLMT